MDGADRSEEGGEGDPGGGGLARPGQLPGRHTSRLSEQVRALARLPVTQLRRH